MNILNSKQLVTVEVELSQKLNITLAEVRNIIRLKVANNLEVMNFVFFIRGLADLLADDKEVKERLTEYMFNIGLHLSRRVW